MGLTFASCLVLRTPGAGETPSGERLVFNWLRVWPRGYPLKDDWVHFTGEAVSVQLFYVRECQQPDTLVGLGKSFSPHWL